MAEEQISRLMEQYERLVYTICFQLVRDAAAAAALILVWAGPDKVALLPEHPRPERPALQETDQLSRRWNEALNHFSHQLREHLTLPDDFLKED